MIQKKSAGLPMVVATGAASILLLTGFGSYGALTAEVNNTNEPQDVSTGTLKLALTDNGQGFTNNLNELAPGDVVNRYVVLTNSGTLDGNTLTLEVSPTGNASLINDGTGSVTTQAVTLAVNSCTEEWDTVNGTCPNTGTQGVVQSAKTLGELNTSIDVGAGTFEAGSTKNLQISLKLPDQNETTTNGNPPTNTVQGKSVAVTYTFAVAQRTATTTNE